ncbi:MAG: hypothetical protein WD601_10010 [Pseudohongiellaceae bacterium]
MPKRMLFKCTLLLLLLPAAGTQAHEFKSYDLNGGHYDDFGTYHCHLAGCEMTEHRYQIRRRLISNTRDQEKFFHPDDWPYWEYPGGGCQDARARVLIQTSQVPVTFNTPRECVVREGLWVDDYTGEEYTRAAEMEIDHIIPPMYANATNGYRWDYGKRVSFANDPLNLIPVSRDTYRSKRSRSIGQWRPREEFLCEYAAAWRDISETYDLDLVNRDTGRMRNILEDCQIEESTGVED